MPSKTPATLEVRIAVPTDVAGILTLISRAYPGIENYSAGQVSGQINNFPQGQFVAGYCQTNQNMVRLAGDQPKTWFRSGITARG